MHHWRYFGHMGWMGWMPLWWILGAALVGVVILAVLRSTRGPTNDRSDEAAENLKHR